MNRGPLPGRSTTDFVAKANLAFGGAPPDWVMTLAAEATGIGLSGAGKRVGYSPAVVSTVISNTYKGNWSRVEETVRGALMGATVDCPVLGEIGRDRCLKEQKEPFRATSSMRARIFHACRAGCPHAQRTSQGDHNG